MKHVMLLLIIGLSVYGDVINAMGRKVGDYYIITKEQLAQLQQAEKPRFSFSPEHKSCVLSFLKDTQDMQIAIKKFNEFVEDEHNGDWRKYMQDKHFAGSVVTIISDYYAKTEIKNGYTYTTVEREEVANSLYGTGAQEWLKKAQTIKKY